MRFVDLVTITSCTRPMDQKMGGRKTFSGAVSVIFIFFRHAFIRAIRLGEKACGCGQPCKADLSALPVYMQSATFPAKRVKMFNPDPAKGSFTGSNAYASTEEKRPDESDGSVSALSLSDFSLSYDPHQGVCMTLSGMAVISQQSLERCYPVFRFFLYGIFFADHFAPAGLP